MEILSAAQGELLSAAQERTTPSSTGENYSQQRRRELLSAAQEGTTLSST